MIPDFDLHGILPPVRPGCGPTSADRSPYRVDILELCQRLGGSNPRLEILRGLLAFREELRGAGMGTGFQWIDGSFAEDVEMTRGRDPDDVDVVTFAPLGDAAAQQQRLISHPNLFHPGCKTQFRVDHYFVATDVPLDEDQVRYVSYWYSMWAHRRSDHRWKGFVVVPLASDDAQARRWIEGRLAAASPSGGAA